MTALAAPGARKTRTGNHFVYPVKATSQIWQNGMVVLLGGKAIAARAGVDAAEAATMKCVGVAAYSVLGGAVDGAGTVPVDRGDVYCLANSAAADQITLSDVGADCYVADDATVAKTSDTNKRPKAGRIEDVTSEGVWVRVGVFS